MNNITSPISVDFLNLLFLLMVMFFIYIRYSNLKLLLIGSFSGIILILIYLLIYIQYIDFFTRFSHFELSIVLNPLLEELFKFVFIGVILTINKFKERDLRSYSLGLGAGFAYQENYIRINSYDILIRKWFTGSLIHVFSCYFYVIILNNIINRTNKNKIFLLFIPYLIHVSYNYLIFIYA